MRVDAVYMGVDPGASGGLVSLSPDGLLMSKMPDTCSAVLTWFKAALTPYPTAKVYVVMEQVTGQIRDTEAVPGMGAAMFSFGRGVGRLEMAIEALELYPTLVTPQKWQKWLGIPSRKSGEKRSAWKNRLKDQAQLLWPKVKVTLAVSDALLLLAYCRDNAGKEVKDAKGRRLG